MSNGFCAAFYKQQAAHSQRFNAKRGKLECRQGADDERSVTLDTIK